MELESFLRFLGEEFDFDTTGIDRDTTFADINFDEFDMIELVMSVEDTFRVEVPDEDLLQIVTIGDMLDFFHKKNERS